MTWSSGVEETGVRLARGVDMAVADPHDETSRQAAALVLGEWAITHTDRADGRNQMSDLFTHGRWVVKDGMEEEFIQLWDDLADWTAELVVGNSWAVLLQPTIRSNRAPATPVPNTSTGPSRSAPSRPV